MLGHLIPLGYSYGERSTMPARHTGFITHMLRLLFGRRADGSRS
jgi:hypothetical protein